MLSREELYNFSKTCKNISYGHREGSEFHLEVSGDGWNEIVKICLDDVQQLASYCDALVNVAQVKEKFGGLRFYYDVVNHEYIFNKDPMLDKLLLNALNNVVSVAEDRCYRTCEFCGEFACETKNVKGWIHTLCNKCFTEATNK